jgi:hypothetical protein
MRSLFIRLLAFATVAPATSSFNTREGPKPQLSKAERIQRGTEDCFIREPIKRIPTTIRVCLSIAIISDADAVSV